MGNGGNAANAHHIAGDYSKTFQCLADVSRYPAFLITIVILQLMILIFQKFMKF